MGCLANFDSGFPGYRGKIAADVPTLAELLRPHGYRNYLVGKWHVTRHAAARRADAGEDQAHLAAGNHAQDHQQSVHARAERAGGTRQLANHCHHAEHDAVDIAARSFVEPMVAWCSTSTTNVARQIRSRSSGCARTRPNSLW